MIYEFVLIDKIALPILIGQFDEAAVAIIRSNPTEHIKEIVAAGKLEFMLYGKDFDFSLLFLRDLPTEYYTVEDYILRYRVSLNYIESGVLPDDRRTKVM